MRERTAIEYMTDCGTNPPLSSPDRTAAGHFVRRRREGNSYPSPRRARELKREHVRIVQASGQSVALNMLFPYHEQKAKVKVA